MTAESRFQNTKLRQQLAQVSFELMQLLFGKPPHLVGELPNQRTMMRCLEASLLVASGAAPENDFFRDGLSDQFSGDSPIDGILSSRIWYSPASQNVQGAWLKLRKTFNVAEEGRRPHVIGCDRLTPAELRT